MRILKGNICSDQPINPHLPECFETIVHTPELLIERIVTNKNFHAPGGWFDQDRDEWVLLIEGEAEIEFENHDIICMKKGDYILIPSHQQHRILRVSKNPGCIWLGIHAEMN
jgi:cupin 2 domain-containing protein